MQREQRKAGTGEGAGEGEGARPPFALWRHQPWFLLEGGPLPALPPVVHAQPTVLLSPLQVPCLMNLRAFAQAVPALSGHHDLPWPSVLHQAWIAEVLQGCSQSAIVQKSPQPSKLVTPPRLSPKPQEPKTLTNDPVSLFHTHFPHCCCKQSHLLPQLFKSHLHNFLFAFPWEENRDTQWRRAEQKSSES